MKYLSIGSQKASQVVLGVMRINGTDKNPVAAVQTALDGGVNFFDNADIYGGGDCEKIFGDALRATGVKREDVYVQTKVGIVWQVSHDFSKKHIVEALNGSLTRLGMDYVDSLLLHRADMLAEPEEVAEAFSELEQAGKVRSFGVSNENPLQIELLKTAVKQPLLYNQLQFGIMHTSMIDTGIHVNMTDEASIDHDRGILEYSRIHGMTIQAWSPFQHGFFEGPFIGNEKFPELNAKLEEIASAHGITPTGLAVAWINRHPANMQTVIGTITPSRIKEVCDASDVVLSREEWYAIYMAAGNQMP